ncbi:hypothetical protein VCHENC02_4051 [Vibrio harveyi]|uniref:Uncharacterized protein n=1 Tax=Vibrio harveyi TaxID=669 RepID=A0A454CV12_VIBHA|nr:hypothetical protein VCHENC02_4051 [Vibrio harveyi]
MLIFCQTLAKCSLGQKNKLALAINKLQAGYVKSLKQEWDME